MKFIRADRWEEAHINWTQALSEALPDWNTRDRFFSEVLAPAGHAYKRGNEFFWYFSEQFYTDVYGNPKYLQALQKLML